VQTCGKQVLCTPKKNPPNWKITLLKKGKRPTSHRSTTYPCYVPILGDFAGADRVGLAVANIQLICIFATENYKLLCCILQGI